MKKENSEGELEFGIYEVYYSDDGEIKGSTKESMVPTCSSADDLKYEMKVMMEAFKKDTLEYEEV